MALNINVRMWEGMGKYTGFVGGEGGQAALGVNDEQDTSCLFWPCRPTHFGHWHTINAN